MIMRPTFPTLLVFGAALTACSSPNSSSVEPLEDWKDIAVDYQAFAPGRGLEMEAAPEQTDFSGIEVFIELTATYADVDISDVDRLLGDPRRGSWAIATSRPAAARAVHDHQITRQQLVTADGQRGYASIANQVAFVDRFEVKANRTASIADPIIETVAEGTKLVARGHATESGAVDLELEFLSHELMKPIATQRLSLPGAHTPVTIQRPVTTEQSTKCRTTLEKDEAVLVAIPLAGSSERVMLVAVTATSVKEKPSDDFE